MHWIDSAEEEAVLHGGFSFTERHDALRVLTVVTITGPQGRDDEAPAPAAGRLLAWQDEPPR